MQFAAWEPIYLAILEDFGFSRTGDEEAAMQLLELLRGKETSISLAAERVCGRAVVVCGNASSLEGELESLDIEGAAFIAADGATETLLEAGIIPEIIVTDLDGPFDAILKANQKGSLVIVHAHADNSDALHRFVPQLKQVIGTAQCRPPQGLYNYGGFTDGDRCVFLARELGAASITLAGFDFEDESVTLRKRKKLAWAKRLIDLALGGKSNSTLTSGYQIEDRLQSLRGCRFSI